ncbi:MAG: hypothetical protein ETSY1_42195 [Candidatus Entotheonella factor]|uniref:Uncharacterized protein n=1 Tax=Entotheonella factor TaxID=1429438 RepID=W4L624_ENTF1|nr:MAG: hypothetical protein ETSY1_42195 [Candidatus Entotheonella factor]
MRDHMQDAEIRVAERIERVYERLVSPSRLEQVFSILYGAVLMIEIIFYMISII